MKTEAKRLNAVIRDIRDCSTNLRIRADDLHKNLTGINASMRSVLEILSYGGPRTVPDIGRMRGVSRQHIQIVANTLLKMDLIKRHDNPTDKRTYFISLTTAGEETYQQIQSREMAELQILSDQFDNEELRITSKMIQKLSKLAVVNIDQ